MRVLLLSAALTTCGFSVAGASAFRVGDQGTDVAEIQDQLQSLGYDVTADGEFGPATAEAIKAFQTSKGITADGRVNSATYSALLGKSMPNVDANSNFILRRVLNDSKEYLGVPYVFGGTTPRGFDCSGYVRYVFDSAGIHLPRTADAQYDYGKPIANSELAPGDLVFFSTYTSGPSHVGIYLGDDKFINASSSRGVSVASLHNSYWASTYIGARRVI